MAYEFTLKRVRYQAATLAEASAIYCDLRDKSFSGARHWPTPDIREVGSAQPVARFSYNGRIWPLEPWTEGQQPLYDNRGVA